MVTIRSDVGEFILRRALSDATNGLNMSIAQMTTGYKVNQAKDNAAGYSIITELSKKISSTLQIQNNSDEGLSMLLTAEGGLEEIEGLLQRLRSIAMQASNGNYDEKSRASMQAEADEIVEQIAQIRQNMKYNGLNLYYTDKNTTQKGKTAISRLTSAVHLSNSNFTTAGNDYDAESSALKIMPAQEYESHSTLNSSVNTSASKITE